MLVLVFILLITIICINIHLKNEYFVNPIDKDDILGEHHFMSMCQYGRE